MTIVAIQTWSEGNMHTTRTIPGLVATARTTKRACGWPSLIVAARVAVSVAGSRVAAQPAANAPAMASNDNCTGKFQGEMMPTTPLGW